MALGHYGVIKFEHILDEEQKIVLVGWVDGVADSSQVSTSVGSTEGLSNASDHLSQADQVRLMHTPLHILL